MPRINFSRSSRARHWREWYLLALDRARAVAARCGNRFSISRCNEQERHLDAIGRIYNETGARVSLRVLLGGKEDPVNPFRLARSNSQERVSEQRTKSDSSGRGEFEPPPPFALTPLTGRDTEFSLLKDRWEQAQEGMGQVLLVVGQPGLGKSRLVQTLTQRVQAQASDASFTAAGESVLALFARLLFLPPNERYSGTGLTPVREREETFCALGQWLRAHSDKRPILLLVEDLHWIDASTLEFLGNSSEKACKTESSRCLPSAPNLKPHGRHAGSRV